MEQYTPELTAEEPPEVIYHYTTKEGLLGIIENGEIWASDLRYLNDAAEFHLAFELIESEMRSTPEIQALLRPDPPMGLGRLMEQAVYPATPKIYRDEISRGILLEVTSQIITAMNKQKTHLCICSFSEERDCLSQWRGYGQYGAAFSIGLYSKSIQGMAAGEKFTLGKCIYDPKEQTALIQRFFKCVLEEGLNTDRNEKFEVWAKAFLELFKCVPLIKHRKFEEEKEWRLISPHLRPNDPRLQFRDGVSMIVPYLCFPLKTEEQPLKIHSITVGPCPHKELSMTSVKSFLSSKGLDDVKVLLSEVPYRNW